MTINIVEKILGNVQVTTLKMLNIQSFEIIAKLIMHRANWEM